MEKIARRNIMAIYGDWRIFRRILKRDLALDRTSGRRRMALSGRREVGHVSTGPTGYPTRKEEDLVQLGFSSCNLSSNITL